MNFLMNFAVLAVCLVFATAAHAGACTDEIPAGHLADAPPGDTLARTILDFSNQGYETTVCKLGAKTAVVAKKNRDVWAIAFASASSAGGSNKTQASGASCAGIGRAIRSSGSCALCYTMDHPGYNGHLARYWVTQRGAEIIRPSTDQANVEFSYERRAGSGQCR